MSDTSPSPAAAPRTDLSPERAANLAENPHAGQGAVMLDVGGDIGAIVLYLTAELEGAEVEYARLETESGAPAEVAHDDDDHGHDHGHGHTHRPHVAVVGRPAGNTVLFSAVFPDLEAAVYRLNLIGETPYIDVVVEGGVVVEVTWPYVS